MGQAVLQFKADGLVLEAYLASRSFVQIIMGPLGSGKTMTTAFKVFELICNQRASKEGVRRSRVAVVRNTYPDLTSTTIRDWKVVVPEGCGPLTMGHPPEHKLDFDLPDGTRVAAEVIFIALDKPEHIKKLRGMQLTFAWVNEGKEVPLAVFAMLTGRVDRYPLQGYSPYVGVLSDTNAWDQDHEFQKWYEAFLKQELPGYEFFIQPGGVLWDGGRWVVNPDRENREFVGPEYYERQIPGKTQDWIKVNLANRIGYSFDGKAVHADYSDEYHCTKEDFSPTPGLTVRVGMDFGLTPAAAFMQRQPNGQWFVFDEIVTEDTDIEEFAPLLLAKVSSWNALVKDLTWVFRGDPSGDDRVETNKGTAFMTLRLNGVPAMPASTNDTQIRRSALDRPLTRTVAGGLPGFRISPRCRVLRKALSGGWCYKRIQISAGEERYREVADKNKFSHIGESAEYALMDGGEHAVINAPRVTQLQPPVTLKQTWNPLDL